MHKWRTIHKSWFIKKREKKNSTDAATVFFRSKLLFSSTILQKHWNRNIPINSYANKILCKKYYLIGIFIKKKKTKFETWWNWFSNHIFHFNEKKSNVRRYLFILIRDKKKVLYLSCYDVFLFSVLRFC